VARRAPKTTPVIVKRPAEERKKLPPELEAFARSDEEKLRLKRPRVDQGKVRDPREGYTVAGVANRDARAVYDQRVEAMRALWNGGEPTDEARAELGLLLLDALRLRLWRARRVTGFRVFAEDVLSMPSSTAEQLASEAAQRTGDSKDQLDERTTALWLRTEAGLYEGDTAARARVTSQGGGAPRIELAVTLTAASAALAGVGARHAPLAREQFERAMAQEERDAVRAEREAAEAGESAEEAGPEADQAAVHEVAPTGQPESKPGAASPVGGARLLTRRARPQADDERAPEERESADEPRGFRRTSSSEGHGGRQGGERGRGFGRREEGDRPARFTRAGEGDRPRRFERRDDTGRGFRGEGGDRPRRFARDEASERPRRFQRDEGGERGQRFSRGQASDRPRRSGEDARQERGKFRRDEAGNKPFSRGERPARFEKGRDQGGRGQGKFQGKREQGGARFQGRGKFEGERGGEARFGKKRFSGGDKAGAGFGKKRALGDKPSKAKDASKKRDGGDNNEE
jgi:hypothetical protein